MKSNLYKVRCLEIKLPPSKLSITFCFEIVVAEISYERVAFHDVGVWVGVAAFARVCGRVGVRV